MPKMIFSSSIFLTSLSTQLADRLGCTIGSLPLTYLGVPIHWRKPSKEVWNSLISKIQRKLSSWKGCFLSLGDRMVMLQDILSVVPLYILSIHKMPVWVREKIDNIRIQFLWQGTSEKHKYPLVRWSKLGGWGFLDLDKMNKALLGK
jgi:hypothetical protein